MEVLFAPSTSSDGNIFARIAPGAALNDVLVERFVADAGQPGVLHVFKGELQLRTVADLCPVMFMVNAFKR